MTVVNDEWIIEARESYAIAGEIIQFVDEDDKIIDLSIHPIKGIITNWGQEKELTVANGNFVILPFQSPAIYPNEVEFKMTSTEISQLAKGRNRLEVLLLNSENAIMGILEGTIVKK